MCVLGIFYNLEGTWGARGWCGVGPWGKPMGRMGHHFFKKYIKMYENGHACPCLPVHARICSHKIQRSNIVCTPLVLYCRKLHRGRSNFGFQFLKNAQGRACTWPTYTHWENNMEKSSGEIHVKKQCSGDRVWAILPLAPLLNSSQVIHHASVVHR